MLRRRTLLFKLKMLEIDKERIDLTQRLAKGSHSQKDIKQQMEFIKKENEELKEANEALKSVHLNVEDIQVNHFEICPFKPHFAERTS